ncbi:MAG: hypothetical protein LC772_04855, partial [Chloroflexi bacterium]|nr:hypothetical protein [Chloroflexota bacterium]
LQEQAAIVLANRPALAEARLGFRYPSGALVLRDERTALRAAEAIYVLGRLLGIDARVKDLRGDWGGAANATLDRIRIGVDLDRGTSSLSDAIGNECQEAGLRELTRAIPHLSAEQAAGAEQRLQQLLRRRSSNEAILELRIEGSRRELLELLNTPGWRHFEAAQEQTMHDFVDQMLTDCSGIPTPHENIYWPLWLRLQFCTRRQIYQRFLTYASQNKARAATPYPHPHIARPDDPVSELYDAELRSGTFPEDAMTARCELVSTWLALQEYYARTGQYPPSLATLVPVYLPGVPADPFSAGAPLHYSRATDGFVLYSVGPDGRDDGGKPFRSSTGDDGIWGLHPTSKGDIGVRIPARHAGSFID